MAVAEELDSFAWRDPTTDVIYVRVREHKKDSSGKKIKSGVIIKMTDEIFVNVCEGMEYPQRIPKSIIPERVFSAEKIVDPDRSRWTSVSDAGIE